MGPRLEIHHLQMLAAIAEAGGIAAAAERLAVTPSALSHRIREAERRLDVVLFVKAGRRLSPTPACDVLLITARDVLASLERAEIDAQKVGSGAREVVRLGLGAYSAYHWLPSFLSYLAASDPSIQIEIVASANRRPEAALLEHEIDLAIVPGRPARPGLAATPLFEDELVAILSPRHALAAKPVLEPDDFAEDDYITYSVTPEPGYEYDRVFRRAARPPRRDRRVEQIEAIVEMVKAGFGLSILTRWAMEPHLRAGTLLCKRVTENGLQITWSMLTRSDHGARAPAALVAGILAEWHRDSVLGFRTMEPVAPAVW